MQPFMTEFMPFAHLTCGGIIRDKDTWTLRPPDKTINRMSDNNGQLAFSLGNLPLGYPVDINMTEDPWSAELALHIEYEHLYSSIQSKYSRLEELDRENFYSSDVSQETLKHYSEIVDRVKKIFGNDTNKTILEIGCGVWSTAEFI